MAVGVYVYMIGVSSARECVRTRRNAHRTGVLFPLRWQIAHFYSAAAEETASAIATASTPQFGQRQPRMSEAQVR
jgi:hypothetical protein